MENLTSNPSLDSLSGSQPCDDTQNNINGLI